MPESPPPPGALTRELSELSELAGHVPGPIAERLAAAAAEVTASGVAPGLAVGDRAPDFILPNAVGQPVRLTERLTGGPVVLSFYRGEWCPFCNIELRALQSWLPRFASHGASLIAVSPQSRTTACPWPRSTASPSTCSATFTNG